MSDDRRASLEARLQTLRDKVNRTNTKIAAVEAELQGLDDTSKADAKKA